MWSCITRVTWTRDRQKYEKFEKECESSREKRGVCRTGWGVEWSDVIQIWEGVSRYCRASSSPNKGACYKTLISHSTVRRSKVLDILCNITYNTSRGRGKHFPLSLLSLSFNLFTFIFEESPGQRQIEMWNWNKQEQYTKEMRCSLFFSSLFNFYPTIW